MRVPMYMGRVRLPVPHQSPRLSRSLVCIAGTRRLPGDRGDDVVLRALAPGNDRLLSVVPERGAALYAVDLRIQPAQHGS